MAISDVKVNITLEKVVQRLGFGIPLIMTAGVTGEGAVTHAYSEFEDISAVKREFGDSDIISVIASMIFAQENAPEKIACCSTSATNLESLHAVADQGFRQVILTSLDWDGESSELSAVFDWCEENKKVLFTSTNKTDKLADFSAKRLSYDHVVILYYEDSTGQVVFPEAALVGATAGKEVGSFTYKNQILANVLPMVITAEELTTLHEQGLITILSKAGDIVSSEGKSFSGQYIDIVDSKDWLVQQITYKVQKLLNYNEKIPYDSRGIDLIDSAVNSVLLEAYQNGMIAEDADGLPAYWTKFKTREESATADIATRRYIGGKFGFTIAGAVHTVEIEGTIEF